MLALDRAPRSGSSADYPPSSQFELTLGDFTAFIRRHRVQMAAFMAIALSVGALYTRFATRTYQASSILRFEQEQVNLPQLVERAPTENRISTEISTLRGRSSAVAVIDSLGLRARLIVPKHRWPSELFSLLRVAAGGDTTTLVIRPDGSGRVSIATPGEPDPVSAPIGDTVVVAGVTLALRAAALQEPELRLRVVSLDEAVRSFQSALKVYRPAKDVDLLVVQVRGNDPPTASAAANLLAQQLISGRHEVQMARTGSTVRFLTWQLDSLGAELRLAEDALRAYRERAGIVDAGEEGRTQVRRLAQIQADRGALQAEEQALAQLVQQMASDSARARPGGRLPSRALVAFPTLFRNQGASQLLGALAQVENERSTLLTQRTPEDPDVLVLTARAGELDAQLQAIAETYLQGLTNQVAALDHVARGFGGALASLPKKEVQAARLQREVGVRQELYTLVQTRLKEAEITRAMEDPTVRIIDPAVTSDRPIRPLLSLTLALSLVIGSLAAVATALVRELTDHSIRTRADALLGAGLPVVGIIPRQEARPSRLLARPRRRRRRSHHERRLQRAVGRIRRAIWGTGQTGRYGAAARIEGLLVTRPGAPVVYVESWNQLHANLLLMHQGRPPKVLVFTSPLPGEGKTLSIVNFALTTARRGLRVLLIDADLRCGLVGEVFGYVDHPGFAEVLAGAAQVGDVMVRVPVAEAGALTVIPAGVPRSPADQRIVPDRVRQILEPLASDYDLILLDSPPVNLLADAALLGTAADAMVLVVRAGHTRIDALRFAIDQLAVAQAPVVGTVLNDIDLQRHIGDDGSYRYLAQVEDYYAGRD
jgi:capsular exopolysaccharide synthesis family protein